MSSYSEKNLIGGKSTVSPSNPPKGSESRRSGKIRARFACRQTWSGVDRLESYVGRAGVNVHVESEGQGDEILSRFYHVWPRAMFVEA